MAECHKTRQKWATFLCFAHFLVIIKLCVFYSVYFYCMNKLVDYEYNTVEDDMVKYCNVITVTMVLP